VGSYGRGQRARMWCPVHRDLAEDQTYSVLEVPGLFSRVGSGRAFSVLPSSLATALIVGLPMLNIR